MCDLCTENCLTGSRPSIQLTGLPRSQIGGSDSVRRFSECRSHNAAAVAQSRKKSWSELLIWPPPALGQTPDALSQSLIPRLQCRIRAVIHVRSVCQGAASRRPQMEKMRWPLTILVSQYDAPSSGAERAPDTCGLWHKVEPCKCTLCTVSAADWVSMTRPVSDIGDSRCPTKSVREWRWLVRAHREIYCQRHIRRCDPEGPCVLLATPPDPFGMRL